MSAPLNPNRRDFVKIVLAFTGTIMATVVGLPAIGYLISPAKKTGSSEAWIPLGPLENYAIGQPTLVSFTRTKQNGWEKTVNSYGVYVVKQNDSQAIVYSNLCTHLSCRVNWRGEEQEYVCPCHDGRFNEQGEVVSGPPPKPLYRYENKVEEGILYIHLMEG